MGGETNESVQNLSHHQSSAFTVCQARGMGHILNWGVRKRSESFTGGACFPELSCCLLTTCQASPAPLCTLGNAGPAWGVKAFRTQLPREVKAYLLSPGHLPQKELERNCTQARDTHTRSVTHSCPTHPNAHLDREFTFIYTPHQMQGLSALVIAESPVSGTREVCSNIQILNE